MSLSPEEKNKQYLKQVLVCRKDLCMPVGKLAAMVSHAAMTFLLRKLKDRVVDQYDSPCYCIDGFTEDELRWMTELDPRLEKDNQISMSKIVLEVHSLKELLEVEESAKNSGLNVHRVVDSGYSHNKLGDIVCIAIGPHWPEELYPVTGNLKIYR